MPDLQESQRIPDIEALKMLSTLANEDLRPAGKEIAWLIRQEYARRYSAPNPSITLAEAQASQPCNQ